ncbi:hypothetical protein PHYPSEUDO_011094 [Phytophthora pseudosyringae]|uniref:Uncharacterized protein n=1 Tax=Phytophthora pseudosyringae TaxID=221518 RepID=A0A8T1W764_9STRA|nr:hypothetical protein PHYPSEUDO_011094 [Phytophthora pseudosyringae]
MAPSLHRDQCHEEGILPTDLGTAVSSNVVADNDVVADRQPEFVKFSQRGIRHLFNRVGAADILELVEERGICRLAVSVMEPRRREATQLLFATDLALMQSGKDAFDVLTGLFRRAGPTARPLC